MGPLYAFTVLQAHKEADCILVTRCRFIIPAHESIQNDLTIFVAETDFFVLVLREGSMRLI